MSTPSTTLSAPSGGQKQNKVIGRRHAPITAPAAAGRENPPKLAPPLWLAAAPPTAVTTNNDYCMSLLPEFYANRQSRKIAPLPPGEGSYGNRTKGQSKSGKMAVNGANLKENVLKLAEEQPVTQNQTVNKKSGKSENRLFWFLKVSRLAVLLQVTDLELH